MKAVSHVFQPESFTNCADCSFGIPDIVDPKPNTNWHFATFYNELDSSHDETRTMGGEELLSCENYAVLSSVRCLLSRPSLFTAKYYEKES